MFATNTLTSSIRLLAGPVLLAACIAWPMAALAQTVTNTASVAPPDGITDPDLTNNEDSASVQVQLPSISLVKSGSGPDPLTLNDTILYSFLVTNTGDTALDNVAVADPLPGLSAIDCPATSLAVGASMNCTASYTITQADVDAGFVANTATVTAEGPGGTTVQDQDSAVLPPTQAPGIAIVKNGTGPDPLIAGSTVSYSFTVSNTGNVTLTNVTVSDPLPGLSAISCPDDTLASAQSTVCSATYTVTPGDVEAGQISNTATATGTPPGGQPPPVAQGSFVMQTTQLPAITLEKTGSGPDPLLDGDTVDYSFLITNSGNVSLSGISINDPLPGLSAVSCPATTLAPAASMTCTASYTVALVDVDAGSIENTATVAGTPPGGQPTVSAQDSDSLPTSQQPNVELVKTGTGPDPLGVGDLVDYSFEITNSGNVTLIDVIVTDALPGLSAVDCPFAELFPAQSMVCAASYEVTQADVDAGEIQNTATVTGRPPSGPEVSAQDDETITLTPAPTPTPMPTAPPSPGGGKHIGVPVLPPFALILLSLLFGGAGWWTLRRKAD